MNKSQSQNRQPIPVEDVMTHDPVMIRTDATLHAAAHLMWTHGHGLLPVVEDDGRLVGIVTDRDLSMCAYTQGRSLGELPVHVAMQRDVISVHPRDDQESVGRLFEGNHIHRVPVIDAQGHVVGILSRADLRRARAPGQFPHAVAEASIAADEPFPPPDGGGQTRLRS